MNVRPLLSIVFFSSLVSFSSCSDDTAASKIEPIDNAFQFKVIVRNAAGAPVPGLRISTFNDPSTVKFSKTMAGLRVKKPTSSTSLEYQLPRYSRITLTIYEMNGAIAQEPLKDYPSQAGSYLVDLSFDIRSAGLRVYKAVLRANNDTTHAVMFRDSVYIALYQEDIERSVIGYTTAAGIVESNDSLSFPHILDLPPIVRTTVQGPTPIDTATFTSQMIIVLFDTATNSSNSFVRTVNKGKNEFILSWTPSPQRSADYPEYLPLRRYSRVDTGRVGLIPKEFRLFQNYPNPFN